MRLLDGKNMISQAELNLEKDSHNDFNSCIVSFSMLTSFLPLHLEVFRSFASYFSILNIGVIIDGIIVFLDE